MNRVEWLPIGHITHGYRRVFTLYQDGKLRHVVNIVPMPYEHVFALREMSGNATVADPSLWWGLSIITQLVSRGDLLGPDNLEQADDGYLQVRPERLPESAMIPLATFLEAAASGQLVLSD